jgi:hypothetical protein
MEPVSPTRVEAGETLVLLIVPLAPEHASDTGPYYENT